MYFILLVALCTVRIALSSFVSFKFRVTTLGTCSYYYKTQPFPIPELSDQLLQRKIELCHELLELADKLEPGWSRFRGTLLLDLQAAMTVQTKREFETDKITKAGAQVCSYQTSRGQHLPVFSSVADLARFTTSHHLPLLADALKHLCNAPSPILFTRLVHRIGDRPRVPLPWATRRSMRCNRIDGRVGTKLDRHCLTPSSWSIETLVCNSVQDTLSIRLQHQSLTKVTN